MGACNSAEQAQKEKGNTMHMKIDRRDFHDQLFDTFENSILSREIAENSSIGDFLVLREMFKSKYGGFSKSEQIDMKFPEDTGYLGPFKQIEDSFVYWGSVQDQIPHGWGEAYSKDGLCYMGYFSDGFPDYYGRVLYVDGSLYEGGIYKSVKDDFGKLTSADGITKECNWRFNSPFGVIKIISSDGRVVYEGEESKFKRSSPTLLKGVAEENTSPKLKSMLDIPTATDLNHLPQVSNFNTADSIGKNHLTVPFQFDSEVLNSSTRKKKGILKNKNKTSSNMDNSMINHTHNHIHFEF